MREGGAASRQYAPARVSQEQARFLAPGAIRLGSLVSVDSLWFGAVFPMRNQRLHAPVMCSHHKETTLPLATASQRAVAGDVALISMGKEAMSYARFLTLCAVPAEVC